MAISHTSSGQRSVGGEASKKGGRRRRLPRLGHERILVFEPDPDLREAARALLSEGAYRVLAVGTLSALVEEAFDFQPELALVSAEGGGRLAAEAMSRLRAWAPSCRVVMSGGYQDQAALSLCERGEACDQVLTPFQPAELAFVVDRQLRLARDEGAGAAAPPGEAEDEAAPADLIPEICGVSTQVRQLKRLVAKAAPARGSVLIVGESGTGKELIAQAIHRLSRRGAGPFVAVNCAALPDALIESELFGHERGAFTGAVGRKRGRFELADGGTLFLDEIGEIPPSTQVKLLRALQEQAFERVGGTQTLKVDVRVVAATNLDLGRMVARGQYRKDLYYRLNVLCIATPPLRERRRDLPALWTHLLARHAAAEDRAPPETAPEVLGTFLAYDWPGNVRELENVAHYVTVMGEREGVGLDDLPPYLRGGAPARDPMAIQVPGMALADIERAAILRVFEATERNAARTAELLGVSLRKVRYRLKAYREAGWL